MLHTKKLFVFMAKLTKTGYNCLHYKIIQL